MNKSTLIFFRFNENDSKSSNGYKTVPRQDRLCNLALTAI